MHPRSKASLLWGVVGLLGFLVLLQGYELWTGYRYDLALKAGVAAGVGVGATGVSYLGESVVFGPKGRT